MVADNEYNLAAGRYKPQVAELVRAQTMLCNRLVSEAKQLLDSRNGEGAGKQKNVDAELDAEEKAGRLLYQVKAREMAAEGEWQPVELVAGAYGCAADQLHTVKFKPVETTGL